MWTRSELKERAKYFLQKNYWMVVVVTLIVTMISGGTGSSGSFSSRYNDSTVEEQSTISQWDNREFGTNRSDFLQTRNIVENILEIDGLAIALIVLLVIILIAVALSIFVFNPLRIGCFKWYLRNRKEKPQIGVIGETFKANYVGTVETMFCLELFIFLWSLLLIIPGIVKTYEYRMIPYILAENPKISRKEAFEMSKQMMDGEKWNTFVLDLSFILWEMLSAVTCGIAGIFYVMPYVQLTRVELYIKLKELHLGIHDDANTAQNSSNNYNNDGYSEI